MGTYIAAVSPWEAKLISRIKARDEGAFQELFHQFQSRVYRTALRILKEDGSAGDALQETFLHIYRGIQHFRGDSKLATWINRITVNVCLEIIRKRKKHQQLVDGDISEKSYLPDCTSKSPFEKVSQLETQKRVHGALTCLGRKHRSVVRLHDLEGFTIREIAQILHIAEGTVKSRLFYGREALKRQLAA
ncbi:MAG: RNA polymerase sigma factor [Acidobacteriota bacterium]